ncbi:MAG: hypothetical protein ACLT9P_04370 [Evtepia gabavorous]
MSPPPALVSGAQATSTRVWLPVGKRPLCRPLPERPRCSPDPLRRAWRSLKHKARLKEIMGRNARRSSGTQVLASSRRRWRGGDRLSCDAQGHGYGGGRGIRLVSAPHDDPGHALAGRGGRPPWGRVGLHGERVHPARHIEVQVLADEAGNVVMPGERDRLVQRHHQKLIESPPPAGEPFQRKSSWSSPPPGGEGHTLRGVGTPGIPPDRTDCLVHGDNPRLQVEHGDRC